MRVIQLSAVLLLSACSVRMERRAPATAVTEAERVVQAQVDAFNRHDVEGFMAGYAPDAVHWEYPADTVFAGAARIRSHYTELFTDPDAARLHAEVRSRIVKGRFVIDEEHVSGLPGEDRHVSVIIYEVVNGRIQNAWFMN
jgi:hypothetical protein